MTQRKPKVTVVIVTYHSGKTIPYTLDALKETYESGLADILVVDNASADGTADLVGSTYPWVTLVNSGGNIGFGRGCNLGFQYIKTSYLMFLNPDAVISLKAIQTLLDFMDKKTKVGICGPAIIEQDGRIQTMGALPNPWKNLANPLFNKWISKNQRYIYPGDSPSPTEWICGACMFLRKEVFENVGGFDPRFFLYFEETDLILRIIQAGWDAWIVGEAICEHVNAASAKETNARMIGDTISEHFFRSRFYYMIKHFGWFSAISSEIGEIIFMALRTIIDLARGKKYKLFFNRLQAPILKLPPRIEITERKS